MAELPTAILVIDEDGYPIGPNSDPNDTKNPEAPLQAKLGSEALQNLGIASNGAFVTKVNGQQALVEAFNEPLVAKSVSPTSKEAWKLQLPHSVEKFFELKTLCVDEWDRFHGLTTENVPFVLSEKAQDQLFNLVDSFDDDSLTYQGRHYPLEAWLEAKEPVDQNLFWSELYNKQAAKWDLAKPAPVLVDLLPRLKIPKARVLVLGCGAGHDAAFFAEQGHLVTAVDFSAEALAQAKNNYSHFKNLKFEQYDIFKLPIAWQGQFDLVFEHTCYCAINPNRRNELIKVWRQMLAPQGFLMGVFFTMHKRQGPPFGGSEWEVRKRLQNYFHFLFWGRWRNSVEDRAGKELAVYAQKKDLQK